MKILVAQFKPVGQNLNKNLKKFQRILHKYRDKDIDLAVFPEYSLLGGFPYGKFKQLALNLDTKQNLELLEDLQELAKKYKLNLIPGSFLVKQNGNYYNQTALISRTGDIKLKYNKRVLWASEKRFLKSGSQNGLITLENFGKIGLQICADLENPSLSNSYNQVSLIINVALWSEEDRFVYKKCVPSYIEHTSVEVLSRARAIENKAYFVFINYAGSILTTASTGRTYKSTSIGESMVVNPFGEIIAKASTNKEEFLLININLKRTF